MGKTKINKKLNGYKKQLIKHIKKFKEAESRDDAGSMNYMAREMNDYIKRMDVLRERLLPKRKQKQTKHL